MAPGRATRVASFLLLLAGGLVALVFTVRLTAAALSSSFSPFTYLWDGVAHRPAALALAGVVAVLAVLIWLVLRHDGETLWLAGEGGGVLVPASTLEQRAAIVAVRSHPDVVRAEVELTGRRAGLRARARVWARPLADAGAVAAAVDAGIARDLERITGQAPERVASRVSVVTVPQLARHLP